MAALRAAARRLGTRSLADVTIFTTLEPCPMCVGAMLECDVAALVFAAPNAVSGAAGTVIQLADDPRLGRRLDVVSGIRRAEAEELIGCERLGAERRAPDARGMAATRRPLAILRGGEVSEWLMVPLSKSGLARASVGSNPTLSATRNRQTRREPPSGLA